jgi:hypothetical protein
MPKSPSLGFCRNESKSKFSRAAPSSRPKSPRLKADLETLAEVALLDNHEYLRLLRQCYRMGGPWTVAAQAAAALAVVVHSGG